MRFSKPVLASACEAASQVMRLERPADGMLSAFFRAHPQLGRQDRALVAETVFAMLRRRRLLEHLLPGAGLKEVVLASWALLLGANLRELEGLAPPRTLAAIERAKAGMHGPLPLAIACDLPDWLVARLLPRFGEAGLLELASGLLEGAPLDLRVNTLRTSREQVLAALAASNLAAVATPHSAVGVRIAGKPAINQHALFKDGSIEVQDEGSQLLCHLVAARRGEMVADFCAGAGGKTLSLGAMMRSSGRLYAFDVSEPRLSKLRDRVARAGLSNVQVQRIEGERDVRLTRLAGKLDRVLVDAPCSGLGTLRRNPDLKWRQTEQSVEEMRARQAQILASAARLVKAGGRLVYATCSLLEEENQRIVEEFLATHAGFRLKPVREVLEEQHVELSMGDYLELFPHRHGTDGFFAAVMERAG